MAGRGAQIPANRIIKLLSRLLLQARGALPASGTPAELRDEMLELHREEFDEALELANRHHVVVRALELWHGAMRAAGDTERTGWAEGVLAIEHERIKGALPALARICAAFERYGYCIAVIKSLDHWPDIGSDLDLYTDAEPVHVLRVMRRHFCAELEHRSWGDRLACKWNFRVPGLQESVEIHVGRLGQTGEQMNIASSLLKRSRKVNVEGFAFCCPSIPDRLMLSTLQRMYRHFYFRLCDIVDSGSLADRHLIDYDVLRSVAQSAGIWEGVATYMAIVSDYVQTYRGFGLDLPQFVRDASRFGGNKIYFDRGYLRIPIVPQSVGLYGSQLAGTLTKGELRNGARLSLLPWLATAAAVGQKLTGSDKGIW
jgi:hypothetical protein